MRRLPSSLAAGVTTVALALALPACLLYGDDPPPEVTITSPTDGALIDDRGTIELDVDVVADELDTLELLLDGAAVAGPPTITPAPTDAQDCRDGCTFHLSWDSREAREGGHSLAVRALARDGRAGADGVALRFEDVPAARIDSPTGDDLQGAGTVALTYVIEDRGDVTAELWIDDVSQGVVSPGDCRRGCLASWDWDTAGYASGTHQIALIARDALGHEVGDGRVVTVGDLLWVSSIEVTGETDGLGSLLEVEVHLFDADSGAFLGCAGQGQGLEDVDLDDVVYDVFAPLVTPAGRRLDAADLAGRNLRLEVIEDDQLPCLAPPGPADDPIGTLGPVTVDDLTAGELAFGNVLHLELGAGRPFDL
ncbi:MAG: hypothetical protein H6709_04885 [Kofleriaceae bacterium]|nr:hypothetical protein [Kofleriaceae bacterium]MCB9571406.1 hypothetical protein [Kofleriaceae bacterium]